MEQLKKFFDEYKFYIVFVLVMIVALIYSNILKESLNKHIERIEYVNNEENKYEVIYKDQTIASLKKENKDLYDSIKAYKDEIDYIVQFTARKQYKVDTVFIERVDTVYTNLPIKPFRYSNTIDDKFKYDLSIGSIVEPNWYALDIDVTDTYTLVNRKVEDVNHLSIQPNDGTTISDVTVLNNKKTKLTDYFSIGPTISLTYDVYHHTLSPGVGVGITFHKKKR